MLNFLIVSLEYIGCNCRVTVLNAGAHVLFLFVSEIIAGFKSLYKELKFTPPAPLPEL
jgi:hypothetical protein